MQKLKRSIYYCFTVAIIGYLGIYVVTHWKEIKGISNFSVSIIILMYLITLAAAFNSGLASKILLNSFHAKVKFWDMFHLYNSSILLNYLPFKFGTLFRASYLKKNAGLKYARFGTFFVYQTLIMVFSISVLGLFVLFFVYSLSSMATRVLFILFIIFFLGSFVLLFIRVPLFRKKNKVTHILNDFLLGRSEIQKNTKILLLYAFMMGLNFISGAIRLAFIYEGLGQNTHIGGLLILGAAAYFSMFISITPGALGIKELALASAAEAIGIPLNIGMSAALLDRAIGFTFSFTIGGFSTFKLWKNNPLDFTDVKVE